ncbi:MAG: tRNA guanosine(34) transglycosylase Tgt [Chloracidobacterium sp. CP2_5A]|nr:MAG: tRNA guanosine(34) transglycosylase Tgt [Chloracidobacterium sp. CP2_5A]
MSLRFEVLARDCATEARRGRLTTARSVIETPVFMPVGTAATVKALTQEMLEALDARIILGNTYHLFLRPGHGVIRELGGLHRFMSWPRSILTDSGGYQVFSLGELRTISEAGVAFRSHLDGSQLFISPEVSMDAQIALGADIVMAFDECPPYPATHEQARVSLELTERWARRCRTHFDAQADRERQSLFGIVQGGIYADLRARSLEGLLEIGFDGYAIGGLSVGEEKHHMYDTTAFIAPRLPADKPRYLMGVGTPADLVESVARGVDMFDCVMPTRHARNGTVFTSAGKLNLRNARYIRDDQPLDAACACFVCRRYSRAYVAHLTRAGEILASVLATYHNVHHYLDLMGRIRHALERGEFGRFVAEFRRQQPSSEESDSL